MQHSNLRKPGYWLISTVCAALMIMSGFAAATTATVLNSPGDLDATFSGDGVTGDFFGLAWAAAVQPDGKIVAAGGGYSANYDVDFVVARYNEDGSPDQTFGGGTGRVTTDIYSFGYDEARAIAIQPDGKIVVAGVGSDCYSGCTLIRWGVVRYNLDGSLDTSFDGDGIVAMSIASNDDRAYGITLQPNGKILVAGRSGLGLETDFTLVRYNPNGSLDATFDSDGIVRTAIGGEDFGYSVALQPDGKIVVAGERFEGAYGTNTDFAVVRYNSDGSLDSTFDSDGKVTTPIGSGGESAFSVAIQSDGKIVTAGYSDNGANIDFALVRYNANGSLDTSFDFDGKVTTPFGSGDEQARSVAIQTDGKIVATGPYWDEWGAFALARYNPNGSLDTTFGGGDGRTTTTFNYLENSYGIAIDGSRRAIVVGHGFWGDWGEPVFLVARYLLRSRTRFDFDGDGRSDVSVFRPNDSVWYLDRSTDQFTAVQFGLPIDQIVPADYDGDGQTDIAVFRGGAWWILQSSNNTPETRTFGIAGDVPVPADYTGDGRDELAVYRNGQWWTLDLSNNQSSLSTLGSPTDKPVPADFDGDGRVDHAVYRNGEWHINRSSLGRMIVDWGLPNDRTVVGDYDGDGKADPAVYRDGSWYALQSTNGWFQLQWGLASDVPVPADYDGDGKIDVAVFRDGVWYLHQTAGGISIKPFGLTDDQPTPASFIR